MRIILYISFLFLTISVHAEQLPCIEFGIDTISAAEAIQTLESCGDSSRDFIYFAKLGDSYLRNKQEGKAILNYERARLFNSRNSALLNNLTIAYEQSTNPAKTLFIEDINGFSHRITNPKYRDILVLISIGFLILSLFFIYRKIYKENSNDSLLIISSFSSVILICLTLFSFSENTSTAVVLTSENGVYESPTEIEKAIYQVNEGYKIEVLETFPDWSKVVLATGQEGWLKNDCFEFLEK